MREQWDVSRRQAITQSPQHFTDVFVFVEATNTGFFSSFSKNMNVCCLVWLYFYSFIEKKTENPHFPPENARRNDVLDFHLCVVQKCDWLENKAGISMQINEVSIGIQLYIDGNRRAKWNYKYRSAKFKSSSMLGGVEHLWPEAWGRLMPVRSSELAQACLSEKALLHLSGGSLAAAIFAPGSLHPLPALKFWQSH